jgi:hypothetical protein
MNHADKVSASDFFNTLLDNIANTLAVWKVVLGGRVFEERQPLTAHGGEDVGNPDDPHSHH